jgi:ribonuclease P protein component
MRRELRLTSSADFQRVRRTGKSYAHPLGVLIASPNGLNRTRFGVTAGRTVGNAVRRNRAKRRLRHAIRSLLPETRPGWDLVVVARSGVDQVAWSELLTALGGLLRRARVMEGNQ